MNDTTKVIINYIVCFFIGVLVTLSITIPINIAKSNNTNRQIGELSARLSETDRRLSDAKLTITECRESAQRISDAAQSGSATIGDVITNLKYIRDEIQILEGHLDNYNINIGNDNSNIDSAVGE